MAKSVHDFTEKTIDGAKKSLADYKGRVLLIVNVASYCGYTKQYTGLEELQKKYGEKGLSVLGFPANEFGSQEPDPNAKIKEFCTTNFGVTFDMFAKVKTLGDNVDPLYEFLQSPEANPSFGGHLRWNFTKFLVDKDGTVIGRWEPKVEPTSAEITSAIEKALAN